MSDGFGFGVAGVFKKPSVSRTLTAITPAKGNDRGGTSVTISGVGFTGLVSSDVTVGGAQLTSFVVASDTVITGKTAAHARGAVDVVMTGATTLTGGFEYLDALSSEFGTCVFWIRADKGTTVSGGTLTAIADQSATGDSNQNLALSGGGAPTYNATDAAFNNRPTFGVSTINDAKLLVSGTWSSALARSFTVCDVIEIPSGAGAGPVYFELAADGSSTGAATLYVDASTGTATVGSSTGLSTFSFTLNQALSIVRVYHASTVDVYVNQTLVATLTGANAGTDTLVSMAIGTYTGQPSQWKMAERAVYSNAFDATKLALWITSYACDAYAITAPPPAVVKKGSNLGNMEFGYTAVSQATGPVENSDYPKHSTKSIDYMLTKSIGIIRFTFSWEGMQKNVGDTIPAASGNYKTYYDDYKAIVDYATAHGMIVIVTPWQADSSGGAGGARYRGHLVGTASYTAAQFAAQWAQLAAIFKSNSNVWFDLVNEPNSMSTMTWFATAQTAINAIRGAGFTNPLLIPGNGYSGAEGWLDTWYDTAGTPRSNAYGWLNANGVGSPLTDSANNLYADVHLYLDDAGGSSDSIVGYNGGTAANAARDRMAVTVNWARTNGVKVFCGEVGLYAGTSGASTTWANFISYLNANSDVFLGFCWWNSGAPGWWDDIHGPHFAITPTSAGTTYTGDTINMTMIASSF